MNIKDEIQKLQKNRLLKNKNEVHDFEEAIENILSFRDVKLVKDLCSGFDDQTEDYEVMFGLVHVIEDFTGEEGLYEMAKAIPDMLPRAKEWVTVLHYRILIDDPSRELYTKVLKNIN
jgi:hypothetical protein